MKTDTLLERYGANPFGKYSTANMRTMGGVLFLKLYDSTSGMLKGWRPLVVVDENIVLTPVNLHSFTPRRTTYGSVTSMLRELSNNRTLVEYFEGRMDSPILLEPKRKTIPNRREIMASLFRSVVMGCCVFPDDAEHARHRQLWWDLMWEFTITNAAHRMVAVKNSYTVAVNKLASENKVNSLNALISQISIEAAEGRTSKAPELLKALAEMVDKLDTAVDETKARCDAAVETAKNLYMPNMMGLGNKSGEPSAMHEKIISGERYSTPTLQFDSDTLLDSWVGLTRFLRRIGCSVPTPFGMQLCEENLEKLAALRPTSYVGILDPHKTIREMLDAKQEPTPTVASGMLA